eukprot:1882192-Rhodomonas_salina.4
MCIRDSIKKGALETDGDRVNRGDRRLLRRANALHYAMPGTGIQHAVAGIADCDCIVCGTDLAWHTTRVMHFRAVEGKLVRTCYALSGTDIAYGVAIGLCICDVRY